MWVLVVTAAISSFSMRTSSLDDCIEAFESTRPPQVVEAYCMDTDANLIWLVPPPSKWRKDRAPPPEPPPLTEPRPAPT
jgi:hypothetical protein